MFGPKSTIKNPEFERKWKQYKETHESMKQLEKSLVAHLQVTKDYVESCSSLSVQIGSFFKSSDDQVSRRTLMFAKANSYIEQNCFKAIEKLYQEQILQPMKVLWVMDAEYRRAIKERKKLIKNENKRFQAYQAKQNEKASLQKEIQLEKQTGKQKKRILTKRKDIAEVNQELENKKRLHEEAHQAQEELTKSTMQKLDSLANSRFTGELLGSAVSGVLASQHQLAETTLHQLGKLRSRFKESDVFKRTLCKYEDLAEKGHPLDQKVTLKQGFVFGRMLTSSTPDVVCDCITYIKNGIEAEGLFRIPGNRINVESIQASYDKNEKHILNEREDIDIHDVCSALKYYFNTLPEPLIPYTCYEELEHFFSSEENRGVNSDEQKIVFIIKKIPEPYIGLLGYLLNFLHDVSRNQASNHMSSTNLATCFAPVLLKPRPDPSPKSGAIASLKSMKNIAANIATVTILIENARQFSVPKASELKKHTNISDVTITRVNRAYLKKKKASARATLVGNDRRPLPEIREIPPVNNGRQAMEINLNDVQALNSMTLGETMDTPDILQSEGRKNRGFIRRVSLENEDILSSRPLPPVAGPPGLLNTGGRDQRPSFPSSEIPSALLGLPGEVPSSPAHNDSLPPAVAVSSPEAKASIDEQI